MRLCRKGRHDLDRRRFVQARAEWEGALPIRAPRSGTTAHPIHEGTKAKPVLEERFVVTIRVDRIGEVAEHVLDQLPGITRPPQHLFRFGVGIQSRLHGMDIPSRGAAHERRRLPWTAVGAPSSA